MCKDCGPSKREPRKGFLEEVTGWVLKEVDRQEKGYSFSLRVGIRCSGNTGKEAFGDGRAMSKGA